jgi:hypothetical protein
LEGLVAAILLLTSLVFALQVTAVTPLSASTSSQHIENQQEATVEGMLAVAERQGILKPAILYGNDTADGQTDGRVAFHQTDTNALYYVNRAPTNRFGALLERTFAGRGLAYNVFVVYETAAGTATKRMLYQGDPSDNAVAASRTVTLYDDDVLYRPENDSDPRDFDTARPTSTNLTVADTNDDTYVQDSSPGRVFGVVEVEVVGWRQ